jgi:hypothetical protein
MIKIEELTEIFNNEPHDFAFNSSKHLIVVNFAFNSSLTKLIKKISYRNTLRVTVTICVATSNTPLLTTHCLARAYGKYRIKFMNKYRFKKTT